MRSRALCRERKRGASMFTGLVRCLGTVAEAASFGKGRRFRIELNILAGTVEVGQSVAVNGTCLTVTTVAGKFATFDVVAETVSRTNLGMLRPGDVVNLEPALKAGEALDGHFVLGHVDAIGRLIELDVVNPDQRVLKFSLSPEIRHLVAEKGSIAIDGISLTVSGAGQDWFTIAVIPHSWANSTLSRLKNGDAVNLEVDVLARYAARIMQYGPKFSGNDAADGDGVTLNLLKENGFL